MKAREIAVIKMVLAVVWPLQAYAATVTLGAALSGVPSLAWAMVTVLSSISGLAALLNKLKDNAPARPKLFVAAHMLGSMLAGMLTFFVLSGVGNVEDFFQVVLISVGAYAGASLLDASADALSSRVKTLKKEDLK